MKKPPAKPAAAPVKRGPGRPTKRTPEIIAEFLQRYGAGETISEICRDEHMPARMTLWQWRTADEQLHADLVRAREACAETIEDRMSTIEQQVLSGEIDPQAANVVLSSQRWRARVLHPARFGDKVDVKHSGQVGLSINIDLGPDA